jgi:Arc/MetJ family transcription regulator
MRTKIEVDDALLSRAMAATGLSREATVEEALRAVLRIHEQVQAAHALKGIGWQGDLKEMRVGRRFPKM